MKRPLALALVVGSIGLVGVAGATVTLGAETDTACWDEYDLTGTAKVKVVAPIDLSPEDCTSGEGCFFNYSASDGAKTGWLVPYQQDPAIACAPPVASTTTVTPTTIAPPPPGDRFGFVGVGQSLPDGAVCATRIRPMMENRPENAGPNSVEGTKPNGRYPRATGDFTGSTDEIIQWVACKWGVDEDYVRAQIVAESYWSQATLGDFTTDPNACSPAHPIGDYPPQHGADRVHTAACPESVGLGQVRWLYHQEAFEDLNATLSSAYNLDYTYAVWRSCFDGEMTWLDSVDGRGDYVAGDAQGCFGVWFSGRWYTERANGYISNLNDHLAARTWETAGFPPATPISTVPSSTVPSSTVPSSTVPSSTVPSSTVPSSTVPSSTVPSSTVPSSTVPSSTVPSSTVPSSTVPSSTVPSSTVPSSTVPSSTVPSSTVPPSVAGDFVETFDGNAGLERFDYGLWHRDDVAVSTRMWTGDHDLSCGSPDTQRPIRRENWRESFYMCRDHMMTAVGATSGYSIGWFIPKQTFDDSQTSVSWDVNVTDLKNRQWWEVMIYPVSDAARYYKAAGSVDGTDCTVCTSEDFVAKVTKLNHYGPRSIVVGNGPYGTMQPNIHYSNVDMYGGGFTKTCAGSFTWFKDSGACDSKKTRLRFSITDNQNGTISVDYGGAFVKTFPGSFPDEPWRVVFKDHNYTPDKDGVPIGHTWHWDNITVT